MGRPLKKIDPEHVEALAGLGATVDEIAIALGTTDVTLRKRFLPIIEKGRAKFKVSLRRKQAQLAMSGNVTMCIWLGKQLLGQTDKVESQISGTLAQPVITEVVVNKTTLGDA